MKMIRSVVVFCGSRFGKDESYSVLARRLATYLADHGIELIFGGADLGLMKVLADTMIAKGGVTRGVIPECLSKREIPHPKITELIFVDSMHDRKKKMFDLSDACLMLPGGLGTLDEFFEILTWAQIGLHKKPIIVVNHRNFFTPLLQHLEKATAEGFISSSYRSLFYVANDLEQACSYLESSTGSASKIATLCEVLPG